MTIISSEGGNIGRYIIIVWLNFFFKDLNNEPKKQSVIYIDSCMAFDLLLLILLVLIKKRIRVGNPLNFWVGFGFLQNPPKIKTD